MQILEEINTFQTQLDDVTKGVNRIRYLKQKINSSMGIIKAAGSIDDESMFNGKVFSPINGRFQSQRGTNKKNGVTLKSQRNKNSFLKQNKDNVAQNHYNESKNFSTRNKWNDSFNFPTQKKTFNSTFRHQNSQKNQTFYLNSLMKNIDPNKKQQISLKQLKKINYDSIKRQRQELKKKIHQSKQNRNRELQMRKQKVLFQQRIAKKKTEGFMLQKIQDLRVKRQLQKSMKAKILSHQIKEQLQLEYRETQRLRNFQNSIFLKQNMKKIIEQRIKSNQSPRIPTIQHQQQQHDLKQTHFVEFEQSRS